MQKNRKSISDIFVKKIVQKGTRVCKKDEILKLWKLSGGSEGRYAAALTGLSNRGLLFRMAKDVYLLNPGSDIDDFYWSMIARLVSMYTTTGAIIASEKALEMHMKNQSLPSILVLYTADTSLRIRLYDDREVHFRTLRSGEKTGYKSLFPLLKKWSAPLPSLS